MFAGDSYKKNKLIFANIGQKCKTTVEDNAVMIIKVLSLFSCII